MTFLDRLSERFQLSTRSVFLSIFFPPIFFFISLFFLFIPSYKVNVHYLISSFCAFRLQTNCEMFTSCSSISHHGENLSMYLSLEYVNSLQWLFNYSIFHPLIFSFGLPLLKNLGVDLMQKEKKLHNCITIDLSTHLKKLLLTMNFVSLLI